MVRVTFNPGSEARPEAATPRRVAAPRTDVIETPERFVIVADLPGADPDSVNITLEHNILTIEGRVRERAPEGHQLAHVEFELPDYRRVFTLSEAVDRERIDAEMRDGVLRLALAKAGPASAKRIPVRAH